jgi:hypothetical protein
MNEINFYSRQDQKAPSLSFVQNTIEYYRLLGNIETFEMDKYYKLFPDLVEKIH